MIKTYCYKLYSSKRNKRLNNLIDTAADIYNDCLSICRRYYKIFGKTIPLFELSNHIAKFKKRKRYSNWKTLNSQAVQDIAERIDRSYRSFLRWYLKRTGPRRFPPKFKKKSSYKSFTLKQCGYKFMPDNSVILCGHKYKYFKSRVPQGIIKRVTIKRNTVGDIYIYVVCKVEDIQVQPREGNAVGLDFGIQNFITCSNGETLENPRYFERSAAQIAQLSKNLSHKQQYSSNWRRSVLALARKQQKIENQRKDFQFKLARQLALEYSVICVQDQNIRAMQKKWGKKSNDLAISNFMRLLEYECSKQNTRFIKVDKFYPSSQICNECGIRMPKTGLFVPMVWECSNCGVKHNKNINAAKNILAEGLRQIS